MTSQGLPSEVFGDAPDVFIANPYTLELPPKVRRPLEQQLGESIEERLPGCLLDE
jgi:hypothetical protein